MHNRKENKYKTSTHQKNKSQSGSFYRQFSPPPTTQTSDVTKTMKGLTLHSDRYSKYLRNYLLLTQHTSFKVPEITTYPIFKNKDLLPLSSVGFSSISSYSTYQTESTNENKRLNWIVSPQKVRSNDLFHTALSIKKNQQIKLLVPPKKEKTKGNEIDFLLNILFHDNKYDKLVYDEKAIFYNEEDYYRNIINNEINKWKNKSNENDKKSFARIYNNEKQKIELKLNSISITFKNLTDQAIDNISITLPFDYLSLFYHTNFTIFKYILLSLIKFNSDYTNISLDTDSMINFLKRSIYFKPQSKKRFNFLTTDQPGIIEEEKKNNKKGNIYIFCWNTPKYIYQVKIVLPFVKLTFLNLSTQVFTRCHSNFILYLINNNFKNWDYYTIRYLFSIKKFRKIIMMPTSKIAKVVNAFQNSTYVIIKDSIVDFIDEKNIEQKYLYFNTDEHGRQSINIIHSYSMISYSDMGKNTSFLFNLNQMKILSFISQYEPLSSFLLKLLIKSSDTHQAKLNYDFFNTFKENEYKSIFHNTKLVKYEKNSEIDKILKVSNPFLEKIFIKGNDVETDTNDYLKNELTTEGIIGLFEIKEKWKWGKYIEEKGLNIISVVELSPFPEKIITVTSKHQGLHGITLRKSCGDKKIKTPLNSMFKGFGLIRFNTKSNINCSNRPFRDKKFYLNSENNHG